MKNIIILLALVLLSACSENTGSNYKSPIPEEVQPTSSDIVSIHRSKLLILGTPVDVTLAVMNDPSDEYVNKDTVVLLDSGVTHFSYYFKKNQDHKLELINEVDNKLIERIRNSDSTDEYLKPVEIIPPTAFDFFHVQMTLELDRCRDTDVWKKLMKIVSTQRDTLYLTATTSRVNWVLAWDLKGKTFKGLVATDPDPYYKNDNGAIGNQQIILTPMLNVRDANGKLLEDSVFLDFYEYSYTCDYAYDFHASVPRGESYLPRFNPKFETDQYQKFQNREYMEFVERTSDIWLAMKARITNDDSSYAQKSPLYKLIKLGVQ